MTQRAATGFEPEGVAALLHAACSSPGAVHRLPSIAGMWVAFHATPSKGHDVAGPADLEVWVQRLRNAVASYERLEDWIPLDARLGVRARHRGWSWPVHPGLLERPGELIAQLQRWAEVADPELIHRRGFVLGDLVEVALRMLAAEWGWFEAAWDGAARQADPAAPAAVTAGEVEAARDLLALWRSHDPGSGLPAVLIQPTGTVEEDSERQGRLARALEFGTVPIDHLDPFPPRFARRVPALAVLADGRLVPVPAGLVLDGLAAMAGKLLDDLSAEADTREQTDSSTSALVGQLVRDAEDSFHDSASNLLAHLVPARIEQSGRRCLLLCPAARHLVAVQVVAGLSGKQIERAVDRARRDLRLIKPGAYLHNSGEPPEGAMLPEARHLPVEPALLTGLGGRVREDAVVTRVVLVEGPGWAQQRRHRGAVVITLDEWRYLVARTSDPEQLWAFLDELALLPGLKELASYDLRDIWIAYQRHGVLNPSGAKFRLFVPVQDLEADWLRAARLSAADEMLPSWGAAEVERWPTCTADEGGVVVLTDLRLFGWLLINTRDRFAVGVFDPDNAFDHHDATVVAQSVHDTLADLGEAAQQPDASAEVRAGWTAWQGVCENQPVLVEFHGTPLDPGGPHARLVVIGNDNRAVVAYDPDRLRSAGTVAAHQWLGAALADVVLALTAIANAPSPADGERLNSRTLADLHPQAAAARSAFLATWATLSPQLRVAWFDGPVFHSDSVFTPAQVTDPGRARAKRLIATHLHRHGIAPQQAASQDAIKLLTTICPAVLDVLHQELSQFDGTRALRAAADQVERFWELRHRNQQERAVRSYAPALRDAQAESDESLAGRAADLLVEAVLSKPPAGSRRLDHRDWIRLLHLAAECVHLSQNLSAARCGLMELDIEILTGGVLVIRSSGELVDLPQLHLQRAQVNARWLAELVEDGPREVGGNPDRSFQSLRGQLQHTAEQTRQSPASRTAARMLAVDDAMLSAMSTGLDEVNVVLATAVDWPVPGDPDALTAIARVARLAEVAAAWSRLDPVRLAEAVRWLTLTPDMIAAEGLRYWSLEGRNARLALRPFLQITGTRAGPQTVMILPRRASGTRHLFVNYLTDSRLPWPDAVLPPPVIAAQRKWRQVSDHAFELEADQYFGALGITHRRANLSTKAAHKAGLIIPGEIDELAADPDRRILWVAEDKNPHVPFDPDQILYEVVQFNGVAPDVAGRVKARQAKPPGKSYVGTLLNKADHVRTQLPAALALLGITTDTTENWQVVPLMITSRPCAAAAVPDPRVIFTTLSDLEAALTDPPRM